MINTALVESRNAQGFIEVFGDNICLVDEVDSYGRTLLVNCVIAQEYHSAQYLLSKWASTNISDTKGWSALHYACQHLNIKLVELLIDNNIEVNAQNSDGNTPIEMATFNTREDGSVLIYLLNSGANPNIKKQS